MAAAIRPPPVWPLFDVFNLAQGVLECAIVKYSYEEACFSGLEWRVRIWTRIVVSIDWQRCTS